MSTALRTCPDCGAWRRMRAPDFDLVVHLHRQRLFSLTTFGPGARTFSLCARIRRRLDEREDAPADLAEGAELDAWVEVVLSALDGALLTGATPEQIVAAIDAEQTRCEARTGHDRRTADPNRAIEHVREDAAPTAGEWQWWWGEGVEPESYHSGGATRAEAIQRAAEAGATGAVVICSGRREPLNDSIFNADYILGDFHERNEDCQDEDGDLAMDPTAGEKAELEAALTEAFAAWRKRHKLGRAWTLETRNAEVVTLPPVGHEAEGLASHG